MDKLSYALGLGIGQQLKSMLRGGDLNVDDFALAIKDVLDGKRPQFSSAEAQQIVNAYFSELQDKLNAEKADSDQERIAVRGAGTRKRQTAQSHRHRALPLRRPAH